MSDFPIIPGQLPTGFCPASYQDLLNEFSSVSVARIPTGEGRQWIFSAAKPAPNQSDFGWFQLDQGGNPIRPYIFANGAWLSRHPLQPKMTIWWFDALPDTPDSHSALPTFDGGDGVADRIPATLSGPMWTLAKTPAGTLIAAQFPIVAGTLPSDKVLNVGDSGGEENHSLTVPEIPPHTHQLKLRAEPQTGNTTWCLVDPNRYPNTANETDFNTESTGGAGSPAVVTPHNTMPPYVVGYLLQRTSRIYYAVT